MSDLGQCVFWGFLLRFGQAAAEAAPTLLCGLLVTGVLRSMVGPKAVRRLFGVGTRTELPRAWVIGMLLPVCSLGALPVVRELRRAGVSTGTVLAFALATPLLNPLSLLYGLTLSDPLVILCFVLGSLIVSVVSGLAWRRWFARPADEVPAPVEPVPAPGPRRLAAVVVTAARELTGPTLVYCLIALAGTGLLSAVLPFGCLQHTMRHDSPLSPVLMALVALPVYTGPMRTMMRLGLMFEHGNSVGAAYVLLVLGAGANLGLVAWVARTCGGRRALAWFALVTALAVGMGYAAERPLYFALNEENHTHAFDDFSSPFPGWNEDMVRNVVLPRLAERLGVWEVVGLGGLGVLALLGVGLWLAGKRLTIDALLAPAPLDPAAPAKVLPWWNRPLPGSVLVGVALAGLAAFAGVGAYLYYPDPETAFDEMASVKAEAFSAVLSGHDDEAMRHLRRWDDLTRKLQVGVILRKGSLPEEARLCSEDLRERLENLRDALKDGKPDEARALVPEVQRAHTRCRQAFLGEK
jgi:hypothetical protein